MKRLKIIFNALLGRVRMALLSDGGVVSRLETLHLNARRYYILKKFTGDYQILYRLGDEYIPNICVYEVFDEDDEYARNKAVEVLEYLQSE